MLMLRVSYLCAIHNCAIIYSHEKVTGDAMSVDANSCLKASWHAAGNKVTSLGAFLGSAVALYRLLCVTL
jgi:hypothetical protein